MVTTGLESKQTKLRFIFPGMDMQPNESLEDGILRGLVAMSEARAGDQDEESSRWDYLVSQMNKVGVEV
jgi:hypothetical protein